MAFSQLSVVVGRDVSVSRVESDLTDLDLVLATDVSSYDPPAAYRRSPSFHESEVGADVLQTNAKSHSESAGDLLSQTCQSTPSELCHPIHLFVSSVLALAQDSSDQCPPMLQLADDDSKESHGEDLLLECNTIERGRFVVWPLQDTVGEMDSRGWNTNKHA